MARAATTTDAFNAVAEPRRRQLLGLLVAGERPVTEIVDSLGVPQPLVSKHLRVLREVGLVSVRDEGRQRWYRLNGRALKPIYDWVSDFEQLWSDRFTRMDEVLAELQRDALQHDELRQAMEDGDDVDGDQRPCRGDAP